ncbi:MAG: hypothetical protein HY370_01515 [Proteobacteria bacterium]|nr:hypothetical protein [Pseudomonadota bacterium]
MEDDRTEINLKIFFIAAALGAFVLALYESWYDDPVDTAPPAAGTQMPAPPPGRR